jgi:membrane protease YdiL (CAAX protease family)
MLAYSGLFRGAAGLPVVSLVVFGIALPAIALAMTRKAPLGAPAVTRPTRALAIALAYLALFSFVVLGWGFTLVRTEVPGLRAQELLLLAMKTLTMVLGPLALMGRAERQAITEAFGTAGARQALPVTALIGGFALMISAVATGALPQLVALSAAPYQLAWGVVACFIWVSVNAGMAEEVLFRVYLQPRFAAVLRSETAAVVVGAIVFALVHVPGLYLRADQAVLMQNGAPSLSACIAYAVVVLSPPGILFGVLWARTRSLLVLVVVHAMIDLPPNVLGYMRLWQ